MHRYLLPWPESSASNRLVQAAATVLAQPRFHRTEVRRAAKPSRSPSGIRRVPWPRPPARVLTGGVDPIHTSFD